MEKILGDFMIKKLFLILLVTSISTYAQAQTSKESISKTQDIQIIQSSFEPDLCQNGFAGSWTSGCVCQDKVNMPNRYCIKDFKGYEVHSFVQIENKTFTLSGALLNWDNANSFCQSIGFKLASRKDFNCASTGIGCVDNKIFLPIKSQYGNRGFFWLEDAETKENAYYADLNDGTIYNTKKTNNSTIAALCIKED